ncbi:unnamed protein product [Prorocentrum cordatum]|uniref:Uncharacterized protein n=1 Tax=Prorocentrum cordatum TaxID=2364126 RepID=A0ABN9WVL7_9DINO|nr:unnamed protein product [Polarella glacialis]
MKGACAAPPREVCATSPSARRRRRAAIAAVRHAQRAACALTATLGTLPCVRTVQPPIERIAHLSAADGAQLAGRDILDCSGDASVSLLLVLVLRFVVFLGLAILAVAPVSFFALYLDHAGACSRAFLLLVQTLILAALLGASVVMRTPSRHVVELVLRIGGFAVRVAGVMKRFLALCLGLVGACSRAFLQLVRLLDQVVAIFLVLLAFKGDWQIFLEARFFGHFVANYLVLRIFLVFLVVRRFPFLRIFSEALLLFLVVRIFDRFVAIFLVLRCFLVVRIILTFMGVLISFLVLRIFVVVLILSEARRVFLEVRFSDPFVAIYLVVWIFMAAWAAAANELIGIFAHSSDEGGMAIVSDMLLADIA